MTTIPGMEVAASAAGESVLRVDRTNPNEWWLAFADRTPPALATHASVALPSRVLAQASEPARITLAKVELDACGAWVTLANRDAVRPIVVRRAGWVDVRGHPFGASDALVDDRVGLGPGDSLVLARPAEHDDTTGDAFLDHLLSAKPEAGDLRAAALAACGEPSAAVAVVAVPHDLGDDPRQRVARATGIAVSDLELPGYPLGDLQPELWDEPPRPPRLARLRLRPELGGVRDVRDLLTRLVASWRLDGRLDQDALKLAASELATNAVRHAEPTTVTVRYFAQGVRIEVDDASPESPTMRTSAPNEVGGRGLRVVETVASHWGVETRPVGKRVWCEIDFGA